MSLYFIMQEICQRTSHLFFPVIGAPADEKLDRLDAGRVSDWLNIIQIFKIHISSPNALYSGQRKNCAQRLSFVRRPRKLEDFWEQMAKGLSAPLP